MPPFGPDTAAWIRETAKWLLGMEIPSADPAAMRQLAAHQDHVAATLEQLKDLLSQVRRRVRADFSSTAADHYDTSLAQFTTGDNDYIGSGARTARNSSRALGDGAANAEYMHWMAFGQLLQLLIEIAWCIAMAKWTMGASYAWIPWFKYIRSVAIQRVLAWLLLTAPSHQITEQLFASLDSVIQRAQIDAGTRRFHDREMTRLTHGGAGLSGLISAGFSGVVDGLFSHQVRDLLRTNLDTLASVPPPPRLDAPPPDRPDTDTGPGPGPVPGPDINRDLAGVFASYERDLAATFNPPAGRTGFDNPFINKDFRDDLAGVFATHYGPLLGTTGARALGNGYADTLMAHWGRPDLAHRLAGLLHGTPLPPQTRAHLAHTVPTVLTDGMGDYMTRPLVRAEVLGAGAASGALEGYLGEGTANALLTDEGWKANGHSATAGAFQSTFQGVTVDGALSAIDRLHRPQAPPPPPAEPGTTGNDESSESAGGDGHGDDPAPADRPDPGGTAPGTGAVRIDAAAPPGTRLHTPAGGDAPHGRADDGRADTAQGTASDATRDGSPAPPVAAGEHLDRSAPTGAQALGGERPTAPGQSPPDVPRARGTGSGAVPHAAPVPAAPVSPAAPVQQHAPNTPAGPATGATANGTAAPGAPADARNRPVPAPDRGGLQTGGHAGSDGPASADPADGPPVRTSGTAAPVTRGEDDGAGRAHGSADTASATVSGAPVPVSRPGHGDVSSASSGTPSEEDPGNGAPDAERPQREALSRPPESTVTGDPGPADPADASGAGRAPGRDGAEDDFYGPSVPARPAPGDPDDPWNGNPPTTPDFSVLADPKSAKEQPRTIAEAIAHLTDPGYGPRDLDTIGRGTGEDTRVFTMDLDDPDGSGDGAGDSGDPENLPDAPQWQDAYAPFLDFPADAVTFPPDHGFPPPGTFEDPLQGLGEGDVLGGGFPSFLDTGWTHGRRENGPVAPLDDTGAPDEGPLFVTDDENTHDLGEHDPIALLDELGVFDSLDADDPFGFLQDDTDMLGGRDPLPSVPGPVTAPAWSPPVVPSDGGGDATAAPRDARTVQAVDRVTTLSDGQFEILVALGAGRTDEEITARPGWTPHRFALALRGIAAALGLAVHDRAGAAAVAVAAGLTDDTDPAALSPEQRIQRARTRLPFLREDQRQVLTHRAQGLELGRIAERLHMSQESVRARLSGLVRRLGVDGRAEAVAAAEISGLVAPVPHAEQAVAPVLTAEQAAQAVRRITTLSDNEFVLLVALGAGRSDEEITARSGWTPQGIAISLRGIADSLGLETGGREAVAAIAVAAGLDDDTAPDGLTPGQRRERARTRIRFLREDQRQALVLHAQGLERDRIAERLRLSRETVKTLLTRLPYRLGVIGREEASATSRTTDPVVPPRATAERPSRAADGITTLSDGRFEILVALGAGHSDEEITARPGWTPHRLATALRGLYGSLGLEAGDRAGAAAVAAAARLTDDTASNAMTPEQRVQRARTRVPLLREDQSRLLGLHAQGLDPGRIAERLDMPENTVRTHLNRLAHRLGVVGRSEVAAVARAAGPAVPTVAASRTTDAAGPPPATAERSALAADRITTLSDGQFELLVALGAGRTIEEITARPEWTPRRLTVMLRGLTESLGLGAEASTDAAAVAAAAGLTDDTDPAALSPEQRIQRARTRIPFLRENQRQVLALHAQGLEAGRIAERLQLTQNVVKNDLTRLAHRLGVAGRGEAVAAAAAAGWATAGPASARPARARAVPTQSAPAPAAPTPDRIARAVDRINTLNDPEYGVMIHLGAGLDAVEIATRLGASRSTVANQIRSIVRTLGLDGPGHVPAVLAAAGLTPASHGPRAAAGPALDNEDGRGTSDSDDSDDDLYDADDHPRDRHARGPRDDDPPAPPTGGGTAGTAPSAPPPATGSGGATAADRSTGGSSTRRGAGPGNRTRQGPPPADSGPGATAPSVPVRRESARPPTEPGPAAPGSTTADGTAGPSTATSGHDIVELFSATLNPPPVSPVPADDPDDDFYGPAPTAPAREPAPADPDDPWGGKPPTGPDLGALVAAGKKNDERPPTVEDVIADLTYRYRIEDIGHHSAQDARTQVFMAGHHHRRRRGHRTEAEPSDPYGGAYGYGPAVEPESAYPEGTRVSRYPTEPVYGQVPPAYGYTQGSTEAPGTYPDAHGEEPAASHEEDAQESDGDRDGRMETLTLWNRTFSGVEDLVAATGSDVLDQQDLVTDGSDGSTALMRFENGVQAVYKDTEGATFSRHRADAEQLASLVGRAIGANVPGVLRVGETEVFMHFMHGESGFAHLDDPRSPLLTTRDGYVLGLLDVLVANGDRNPGNWLDQGDGHVAGIDHGKAWFKYEYTPEDPTDLDGLAYTDGMRPFYDFDAKAWIANPLTRADIRLLRSRLTQVSADFDHLGRTDWFDEMTARFDMLAHNARGTAGLLTGSGR
ncbi:DNA-binding transcriptional regulator, CsgD family [Nocardiopsis flavescens]|uniref:DNA-binding transcriptional regulator, CsgD family n=1 Tax=Nocardiopsis flavescens TaxID=758803 RepID=A0A1M6MJ51_9ACTN|nr:LuxR C-terminal-related transcriptional regulator [Nocardiopsis flavescens]SHJ83521.1 DNA-binding transcriptional regulator, CsgD family [Nocardiopsis flavescens]